MIYTQPVGIVERTRQNSGLQFNSGYMTSRTAVSTSVAGVAADNDVNKNVAMYSKVGLVILRVFVNLL